MSEAPVITGPDVELVYATICWNPDALVIPLGSTTSAFGRKPLYAALKYWLDERPLSGEKQPFA